MCTSKKTVTVMNVLTEDKLTFYNNLSLEENLISAIINTSEDKRKLLEYSYRKKIGLSAKIEMIPSLNGTLKAYSSSFDLIAYYE